MLDLWLVAYAQNKVFRPFSAIGFGNRFFIFLTGKSGKNSHYAVRGSWPQLTKGGSTELPSNSEYFSKVVSTGSSLGELQPIVIH